MQFVCMKCQNKYPIDTVEYVCECGGLFELEKLNNETIPITVSLGEIVTPILEREIVGISLLLKLDYLMPTGSFKDRGAFILINHLKNIGVQEVVEDSSGNAAASISAYCAAAGIKCNIYVPESTSEGKIKQIKAYGAKVVKVPGSRDDTAKATLDAAKNLYYASHVYNPLFYEGTKSIGTEIYSQVGVPDWIVIPVGNGTMLFGVDKAFNEIGKMPKILAVQSENCTPIYDGFCNKPESPAKPTIAEGIAVGKPMRKDAIIDVIKKSGGTVITVNDATVKAANDKLALMGIYTEPTSATVIAGACAFFKGDRYKKGMKIVAPLTGSGLKKG